MVTNSQVMETRIWAESFGLETVDQSKTWKIDQAQSTNYLSNKHDVFWIMKAVSFIKYIKWGWQDS